MPKRRLFVLVSLGVVLVGIFVVLVTVPRPVPEQPEPVYGGKKLSEWVLMNSITRATGLRRAEAVPFLLKWMRFEVPAWKEKLFGKLNPMLARVQPRWVFDYTKRRWLAECSAGALVRFGPDAESAVGE